MASITALGFWEVAALSRYTSLWPRAFCRRIGKSARAFSTSKLGAISRTLVAATFFGNFATVLIRLPPSFSHALALAHYHPQHFASACHSSQQTDVRLSSARHGFGQDLPSCAPGILLQKPATAACAQKFRQSRVTADRTRHSLPSARSLPRACISRHPRIFPVGAWC